MFTKQDLIEAIDLYGKTLPVKIKSGDKEYHVTNVALGKDSITLEIPDILTRHYKTIGAKGGRPKKFKNDKERWAYHNRKRRKEVT